MPPKPASRREHLRNQSGRYWARLTVPKALRPIIGQTELLESLGPDLAVARRNLPGAIGRMQDRLNAAREQLAADAKPQPIQPRPGRVLSLRNLAQAHYNSELDKDDAERRADLSAHASTVTYIREVSRPHYEGELRKVVGGLAPDEQADALIGWAIDDFRERGNTDAKIGTAEWRELARVLAAIQLEAFRIRRARDAGDFGQVPQHPLLVDKPVALNDPLKVRILGPDSERTISDLGDQFTKDKPTSNRTRHDNKVTMRMLEEVIGEPLPIYRLTRPHVHAFKRALAEAPASYLKRFPGKTLPEAIKANKERKEPFPLLDARTINDKYLARLHAFLNWCVRNDIIPDNPSAGIKVERTKPKERPKVNFTPGDLTSLFGEHFAPKGKWGEEEWATVVALFTGMRATEQAQVRLDSIRTERGVLVIAVEEETKNLGSQRLVPVHSTLVALGFEKHVATLRKQKQTHLFPIWYRAGMAAKAEKPEADATMDHYFPRFIPRRFNVTYKRKCGIVDKRKTWHSFRHTFKSGLASAGVGKDMRDQLAGHSDDSAGETYVHTFSIEAMKEAVEKLRFDGFGLI